jgi:hypothetical protein
MSAMRSTACRMAMNCDFSRLAPSIARWLYVQKHFVLDEVAPAERGYPGRREWQVHQRS